jgi:hypothetical protein
MFGGPGTISVQSLPDSAQCKTRRANLETLPQSGCRLVVFHQPSTAFAMKPPFLACPLLVCATALAAEPALPEFNSTTIGHPPLSLNEIAKGGTTKPSYQLQSPSWSAAALAARSAAQRKVSRANGMPILEPDPTVDYKLRVKAPDPSVDFKLAIKSPEPAPVAAPAK